MEKPAAIFRFGPYELRSRTRELYKRGINLKLRPQPFQVLKMLVEHAEDVVTREELRESLWSAETFVDFEHGLNTAIKELRGVLSDSASESRYIGTVPRVGYRILVPVDVVEAEPESEINVVPETAAENIGRGGVVPDRAPRKVAAWHWRIVLAAAILLVVALGDYFQWSRSRARPQPYNGRMMLAVLPFANLTGDAGQEYFSDGLTEEIIAQLGRIDPEHLGVIARTSVMHYKGGKEPLDQIGRELGVRTATRSAIADHGCRQWSHSVLFTPV